MNKEEYPNQIKKLLMETVPQAIYKHLHEEMGCLRRSFTNAVNKPTLWRVAHVPVLAKVLEKSIEEIVGMITEDSRPYLDAELERYKQNEALKKRYGRPL